MKVLLAGRVSEQITFGRITTGASDDLSRVTAIARSMIHEYGMGTTIRAHQVPARRLLGLRGAAPDRATRRCRRSPTRPTAARRSCSSTTATCSTRSPSGCCQRGDRARRDPRDPHRQPRERPRPRLELARAAPRDPGRGAGRARPPPEPPHTAARRLRARCSGSSTTSASPSPTSTPRSPSTSGTFAMPLAHRETVTEQGVEAALLDVGAVPRRAPAPARSRDAGRQVPGAQGARACTTSPTGSTTSSATLAELEGKGVELIDSAPRTGIRNSRVAFVHPRATGSVLTEIVEPAEGVH